jgi:FKBP-type peptidyl-prolyl cis-trans isomerase
MTHEILEAGRGERPSRHDRVSVHYTGWLADGKVFDSSRKRGIALTFTVGRGEVIRGWDETVLDMQEGETRVVTLPPDLAYGDRGVGPIPPGACLRFEMMLERIERFS